MCTLYSITTNQATISALFGVVNRCVGNLAPMPSVFPDNKAFIVRTGPEGPRTRDCAVGHAVVAARAYGGDEEKGVQTEAKGKPVDFKQLLRMEHDGGTTNIRNVKNKHWTLWLGSEHRCVVPFNLFSEFNKVEGGDICFATRREAAPRVLRRYLGKLDVGP